jgi:hypothetical protein
MIINKIIGAVFPCEKKLKIATEKHKKAKDELLKELGKTSAYIHKQNDKDIPARCQTISLNYRADH